jgi:tryptophan synthase beta chain
MLTRWDRHRVRRESIGRGGWRILSAILLLLSCPAALAMSFGELISQSALNRPLDVVFPVLLDHSGDADTQLPGVNVASDAVYTSMGASKPDLLATATIEMEASGREVLVHVRTQRSVLEPYVPLIVELALPSGVLRHRYDLLLDPVMDQPSRSAARATAAAQPEATTAALPAAMPATPQVPPPTAAAMKPAPPRAARAATPLAPQQNKPAQRAEPVSAAASTPLAFRSSMFQLDLSLHGPIPAAPMSAPALASTSAPATDSAPTLLANSAPATLPPALPTPPAVASTEPARVDEPQAAPAPPDASTTEATPPPASRHYFLLDLIIVLLLLLAALRALRAGTFDRWLKPGSTSPAEETYYQPAHQPAPAPRTATTVAPRPAATQDAVPATSNPRAAQDSSVIAFVASEPEPAKPAPPRQESQERYEGIEVIDASGFYDDVAQLLEQTLRREPTRLDLYRQLIEVYVAAGKPQLGLGIKKQLEALRSGSTRGIDNEALQQELERAEAILPHEGAGQPVGGALAGASQEARFSRYYDGAGFENLAEHLAPVRAAYAEFRKDRLLQQTLIELIDEEVGRPTPLQPALQFSRSLGGAQVYFKREDMRLAGSERIINLIGQTMLMRSMGKLGVVTAAASTGGVAAMVAASKALGMPSTVFMSQDLFDHLDPALLKLADKHQVELLVARDPKDGRRDALAYWLSAKERIGYVTGLRAGPDPYPTIVMDFVAVVGHEVRRQLLRFGKEDPAAIVGSAFGGFSAIGLVRPYLEKSAVRIVMTDPPAGFTPEADATPPPGVPAYELALREQRWLHASGRVEYIRVDKEAARLARLDCDRIEEFMPRPGDAAAIGMGLDIARTLPPSASVIVLLSTLGPP